MLGTLKRKLVGAPIATARAEHERLPKTAALAVFSSDALSSVAYGTEEILRVLFLAGISALAYSIPVAGVIVALLTILAISYRQTIHAYPSGGGAYIVSKENLGIYPGLVAASSLLIDYVLTVSVSIAAGVAAITSAFPPLLEHREMLCLLSILLIAFGNLRGVRESGMIFSVPTYLFIVSFYALIAVGLWRYFSGHPAATPLTKELESVQGLGWVLLLRAFSNGCSALTGVEAISNGVQAFKKPEAENASMTLAAMAGILGSMFLGITALAHYYVVTPSETETVVSQLARQIFQGGWFYYVIQGVTALILILAANTSFADFPRLASILARDKFLPRQLANRGDRLVFSNGILLLASSACVLIIVFKGDTHALIPLYAVGVFLSFTLSQSGMVLRWMRLRGPNWKRSVVVNGVGAIMSGVALVVIASTKFLEGAWVVILLVPAGVWVFHKINTHYVSVAEQLTLERFGFESLTAVPRNVVVVPISGINQAVLHAIRYAQCLSKDVRAVYVRIHEETAIKLEKDWKHWAGEVPLVFLDSPYRSLMGPLSNYLDQLCREAEGGMVTVVLPEFLPAKWWQHFLHNQSALIIKGAFLFRPQVVVVSVPYHLQA